MTQGADQNWVRKLRIRANLTQEELSVRLKISSATLRKWEHGAIEPSMTWKQWTVFCEVVGVPFEQLPINLSRTA
ncbi:MAG: helix-turn-helix domain-containing protein [Myxacorys californica WJT36-NPBG1]|jgi:DNA-binding XRE family transcriptional regulator|nr:helix-turn-helix domain-containing protein [Myxacorys californica WJT36-NPBG1]MBW4541078.1 helix-turn-helix domain-containing protein [Myxacorys chilensis ATA2-1-KO14]